MKNQRRDFINAAGCVVVGLVATAVALALTSSTDIKSVRPAPQGVLTNPIQHLFSEGQVLICTQTSEPLDRSEISFVPVRHQGSVYKVVPPSFGFRNTLGLGDKVTTVPDHGPLTRYRWCAAYKAPRVVRKTFASLDLRILGHRVNTLRFPVYPDRF